MAPKIPLSELPLSARHWYILIVASMEQLIGGALNTVAGIMIPLIVLLGNPQLTPAGQGALGAAGLCGIAIGSLFMGKLMDQFGYLLLFRLCPTLILAGSIGVYFCADVPLLILFLFIIGIGIGGGYSLDSGYISELTPRRWESLFVGLAKATSSLGFVGGAGISYIILRIWPTPTVWNGLIVFVGVLGLLTLILRLSWYQSPVWLMSRGEAAMANKAAEEFLGPEACVPPAPHRAKTDEKITWLEMFTGEHRKKIMLSGVTWACEGLAVYGFGVFLPVLLMALGLQGQEAEGLPKILASVKSTTLINLFIGAGFAVGLAVIHRINMYKLMGWSFLLCAISIGVLLLAYELRWAMWISFAAFIIFETALNAGPHLITFVIPSRIYSVPERGAGMGIATMLGKVGAVAGVFFMPAMLHWGGIKAVLLISLTVQLLGALVTFYYAKALKLL